MRIGIPHSHDGEQVIEGFLLDINQAGKPYAWAALRLPQGYINITLPWKSNYVRSTW